MSVNQQQVTILTDKLESLNVIRDTLIAGSQSTADVDIKITDCTEALDNANRLVSAENALAQNNIDALDSKQMLISNLGTEYTKMVMMSRVCLSGTCVNCMCCKYANYVSQGLTDEQIKQLM